jgi:hypothetical protein
MTTIEKQYSIILKKIIEPQTGKKETYGDDLNRLAIKLFGVKMRGVFPSDKIPKLTDLTPYAILNLDKSTESGSHWIAVAKIPEKDTIICYDSFGRCFSKIIPSLKNNGMKIMNTDQDAEQKIKETNCGARCLAFLVCFEQYGWKQAIKI